MKMRNTEPFVRQISQRAQTGLVSVTGLLPENLKIREDGVMPTREAPSGSHRVSQSLLVCELRTQGVGVSEGLLLAEDVLHIVLKTMTGCYCNYCLISNE